METFEEFIAKGSTPYERLVRYYADGRQVCDCGQAYLSQTGTAIRLTEHGREDVRNSPECRYGCSSNEIRAREEIAGRLERDFFNGRVRPR